MFKRILTFTALFVAVSCISNVLIGFIFALLATAYLFDLEDL